MSGVLGKLKNLDAYPKVNEDFFTKTLSGGLITIVSSVIMVLLFLSELCKSSKDLSDRELRARGSRLCSTVRAGEQRARAFGRHFKRGNNHHRGRARCIICARHSC